MSDKVKDLNDQHREGKLPDDPGARSALIAEDAPRLWTVKDLLRDSYNRAFAAERQIYCTTGHAGIDDATGGIAPEFVWVFGAETSWGKTTWAVAIADENIARKFRVMIISLEDPKKLYSDRLMARRARIDANARRQGTLTQADLTSMATVMAAGEDSPVFIDGRGKSVEWLAKRIPVLVREHGIQLVMLDYLQAADNEKPQQDRKNQVTYIARTATDAIKTSGAAGILFSQITMADDKPIPDKHSVRDSKSVSHMAEVVALGFKPKKHVVDGDSRVLVEAGQRAIFVDKNKDGPEKKYFTMPWDARSACYCAADIDGNAIPARRYGTHHERRAAE